MLRDASFKTQDMLVLDNMDLSVIDYDSLHRYRIRMRNYRPGHVWEELEDNEFLYKLGAAGRGEDGKLHPTAAGLLMFGFEYEIVKEYPYYFLDYQEKLDDNTRWTDRIVSTSGDWSGNIYDFYFRVYNKIAQDIKVPFKLEGGNRIDDTPAHKALREALANCLVNADYYGRQGLVVVKAKNLITFSNPGGFRIDIEAAKAGGVSDPRNGTLIKMFNLIDIGERAGSGIPNIYSVWHKQGWNSPTIAETFHPERITFSLPIESTDKSATKIGDNEKSAINSATKIGDKKSTITENAEKIIIDYLKNHASANCAEIATALNLQVSRTRDYLSALVSEGILIAEGGNKNRTYKLKN
jgi:predicted HTH transcriptional regulator